MCRLIEARDVTKWVNVGPRMQRGAPSQLRSHSTQKREKIVRSTRAEQFPLDGTGCSEGARGQLLIWRGDGALALRPGETERGAAAP